MKSRSEKITSVLIDYFDLDPKEYLISFELIDPHTAKDAYQGIKTDYEYNLRTHPRRKVVAKKLYVSDDFILHVQFFAPRSEVGAIKPESHLYYPVCTVEEIKRIECVSSGDDYLLKLRADAIADNSRFFRIFLARRERVGAKWTLSSHFSKSEFDNYVQRLSPEKGDTCRAISAGFAFISEPNGACIKTPFGKVIIISEALRYFLFYMNLFLFGHGYGLSGEDIGHSLIIAAKTMLLTEPLDFDLDPRSEKLPARIRSHCSGIVRNQIEFVIGHEYSHALLNHFGENAELHSAEQILGLHPLNAPQYFTPREEQEFAADAASILNGSYSDDECAKALNGAAIFFLHLELFYSIAHYINPSVRGVRTHPDPLDRMWKLRETVVASRPIKSKILYSDADLKNWIDYVEKHKQNLVKEFLPFHTEVLEEYGSIYLPSYRKKRRHDRFDY